MKRVLLTGGAGFIGHHTVSHLIQETDWDIVVMDRLTYAGNQNFLTDGGDWFKTPDRLHFVYHDFRSPVSDTTKALIGHIDYIIHMGAESHVDRSIEDPMPFAESNVIGTINMLNYANDIGVEKFIYISTDEVYGPAIEGELHKEGEAHRPSNPYSASKSAAESFCYSYWNTYGTPIIITNTMNNFGERQNKEKFVPKVTRAILEGKEVTLHCKKDEEGNILDISSRCWLHARNHADGLLFIIKNGKIGERYNISGEKHDVSEVAQFIADTLGKPLKSRFEDFHSIRKGHDMHYGLDNTKMMEMGWVPPMNFETSMKNVVSWTKNHPEWLN